MPREVQISVTIYTVDEARQRLGELRGRPAYTRPRFHKIVRTYKPELKKTGYTEPDLRFLADKLKGPGRPPKPLIKVNK